MHRKSTSLDNVNLQSEHKQSQQQQGWKSFSLQRGCAPPTEEEAARHHHEQMEAARHHHEQMIAMRTNNSKVRIIIYFTLKATVIWHLPLKYYE